MAKRTLRIASYNINGIAARLHILLRWLKAFGPDVVALQELKAADERFPGAAAGDCQKRHAPGMAARGRRSRMSPGHPPIS
ncbi:MAG: endonuclease/exonuclease/phosphatase family protein, partial [Alphaproteobacteria bacterium]